MKNFRKIVAILAAALMLFSVLPMSAFAAPGDVIVDINFDDGTNGGFERSYNENGYIVFDASTGDWQNTFAYIGGFQTNVDYVVSFKAKANKDTTMNFKINDNWGADAAAFTVNVTTEWQEFEGTINMATLTSAIVMFSSNSMAADGATYYIDDLKIVEKAPELEVGVVTNGNFENGSEGWTLNGSASIENGALKIDNCSQWSEAAMANIAVEVGTEYTLSWKSQRVSGNGAFLMFVLNPDNSNHPTTAGQNWMNSTSTDWVEHSLVFTASEANLKLKLSAEVDNPGVILIDDITLVATPKPVVGQITNGDFETGDATGWRTWQSTEINADAAYTGSYGANIKGDGGWGGFLDQDFSVEDGKTYEFSFWYKVNSSGFNWSLKGDQSGASYGAGWVTTNAWTQVTKTFIATGDTSIYLNFNGGGTGTPEDAYIDDVKLTEVKDPSDDGFIKNGDFETGKATPWNTYGTQTAVVAEAAHSGDYGLMMIGDGGWGGTGDQNFTTEPGKTYKVTIWIKTVANGVNIQIQDNGAVATSAWVNNATDWTEKTFEYTATSAYGKINFCGGGNGLATTVYVDDIKVKEMIDPSFDGYITNGDFETGELFPWNNLYGNSTVEIVEGMDGGYALSIVTSKWQHVRQTAIAVEPNTEYIITGWAKNTTNMSLLVKDGGDTVDLRNAGISAGDEWTQFSAKFNSGEYTTVIVSLMGGEGEEAQVGTFDNIVMALAPVCEHEYEYDCSKVCSLCGEETRPEAEHEYFYECDGWCTLCYEQTNPSAAHNVIHVEAKAAVSCVEWGNVEYWYCEYCNTVWRDAACMIQTNMMSIRTAGECISNAEYPCQAGECINCSLPCEAEAEHTYDNDYDADCNVCGDEREVEQPPVEDIIYGDVNGDGEVDLRDVAVLQQYTNNWDVTLNVAAADVNGDGEVDLRDVALLQQYTNNWDVTLGPVEEEPKIFNDGVLGGW